VGRGVGVLLVAPMGQFRLNSALKALCFCSAKTSHPPGSSSQASKLYFFKSQTSKQPFTSDSPTGLLKIQMESDR